MKKNRSPIKFIAAFMAFMVALVGMPLQAIALGLENIELISSTVNDYTLLNSAHGSCYKDMLTVIHSINLS